MEPRQQIDGRTAIRASTVVVLLLVTSVAVTPLSGIAGATQSDTAEGNSVTPGVVQAPNDTGATITIESASVEPGETVSVAVAVDGEDVAGYQANVTWDPSVLRFESAEGVAFGDPVTNVDDAEGWAFVTQSQADGTDSPTVAEFTFTVVGSVGDDTDLAFVPNDTSANDESEQLDTDTEDGVVTVVDATAPTADAGENRTVTEGESLTFDGGNSTDDVGVDSYTWSMGDGTTLAGEVISHAFNAPGTYEVTLEVADAAGNADEDTATVTVTEADDGGDDEGDGDDDSGGVEVPDPPSEASPPDGTVGDMVAPLADAGPTYVVNVTEAVPFDATNSTDDVGIESYEWTFGDGANDTGATPIYAYDEPGTYEAAVTVTDAAGNVDTDEATIVVREVNVVETWGSLDSGLTVSVERARAGATISVPTDDATGLADLTLVVDQPGDFQLTVRTYPGGAMELPAERRPLSAVSVDGGMRHLSNATVGLRVDATGVDRTSDAELVVMHRHGAVWVEGNETVELAAGNVATANVSMAEAGTVVLAVERPVQATATTAPDPAVSDSTETAVPTGEPSDRPGDGLPVVPGVAVAAVLAVAVAAGVRSYRG